MDIRELADGVSVCGQIEPGDVADLVARGFRALICNRPNGEAPGQPLFGDIEAAAKQAGLETRYIPITPGFSKASDLDDFRAALDTLPGPVLAYCRSGARSTALFNAVQNKN